MKNDGGDEEKPGRPRFFLLIKTEELGAMADEEAIDMDEFAWIEECSLLSYELFTLSSVCSLR